jgi:hypothetical protein
MKRSLKKFLVASLSPMMAEAGFTLRDNAYFRFTGITQYLLIEPSPWATAASLYFTVAVGASPAAVEPSKASMDALASTGAPLVQRPLATLSGGPATGYELRPDKDGKALEAQLLDDIARFAMPWFAATTTLDGLLGWLAQEDATRGSHANGYIAGIILAGAGRKDEARRQFIEADGVREVIDATARALGIKI